MASHMKRRTQRLFGPRIAIAAGILVMIFGLFFIFGISGTTDRKNAECTEETVGTIISSEPSGSVFSTTVEYTPGYSPMTVTMNTKNQYEAGTEVTVKYHPTSFTRVYIEGMSETGKTDVTQGAVFIAGGAVLTGLGIFLEKLRKKNR